MQATMLVTIPEHMQATLLDPMQELPHIRATIRGSLLELIQGITQVQEPTLVTTLVTTQEHIPEHILVQL